MNFGEKLKVVFGDAYTTAGYVFSGVSAFSSAEALFDFLKHGVSANILEMIDTTLSLPIRTFLASLGIDISPLASSLLVLYLVFGATTIRTFYKVYDPSKEMVVKGIWGRLSRRATLGYHISQSKSFKIVYTALIIVVWPLITLEYSVCFRNIWRRYVDQGGPVLDFSIGTFTTNAKTVFELNPNAHWCKYNPKCDHDLDSDHWYRLEGNFVHIFLMNFFAVISVITILAIFSFLLS